MRVEPLVGFLDAVAITITTKTGATVPVRRTINLFVNSMPATIELGAMIHSGLMQTPIDAELPGYRAGGMFQLIVRAREYEDGYTLIDALTTALTTESKVTIGGMRFNFIRPRHEPLVYPLSPGNLIEFSVNFDCNYVIIGSSEISLT